MKHQFMAVGALNGVISTLAPGNEAEEAGWGLDHPGFSYPS